ncbi:hypothetical protein JD844_024765 [Phrynosoma platyrhinos]|uniref:Uncharacterized protein n=1 Tax=Phrynosoma platyrhinos TaxID=52577 RepID=A0ABQ7SYK6_PHRPL|nr:hypothetical protein JD844_024765 [Phrynosoma platyrhinos]
MLVMAGKKPSFSVDHPHKWNKFYFVHHWPVTVCKKNTNDCKDPLMYWTIHGLWPDKEEECNRTWHFNISELKNLSLLLLLGSHGRHEAILARCSSSKSHLFLMAAIKEALTSVYNVTPKIQCLPPEEGQLQIIGQIKFCLTKEFVLRNCTEPESDSFSAHENKFLHTEDLSNCNDTLTYYPSHMHTWKHFVANTVNLY